MSRRKRPTYTPKAPSKAKSVPAPDAVVDAPRRRRKPRKQDFAAAAIALVIVAGMVASAVGPFFLR